VASFILLPAIASHGLASQLVPIDPAELEAAPEKDCEHA
jgi:hypothetical protein